MATQHPDVKWVASAVLIAALVLAGVMWGLESAADRACRRWQAKVQSSTGFSLVKKSVLTLDEAYPGILMEAGAPPRGCSLGH